MTNQERVEYILYIELKCLVVRGAGWNTSKTWKTWRACFEIGELTFPDRFKLELMRNTELVKGMKDFMKDHIENVEFNSVLRAEISRFEVVNLKDFFEEKPSMLGSIIQIRELSDFVKEFNAGGSQAAPADSPLVCPDSAPVVPADPAPADLAAAPAGFVPAVIQGEFAEIQGSVRDSKRETPLNLTKKANEILERVDEKLGRLVEVNEQTAQNTAKMARNTGTIAENTKRVSRETVERIEKMNGKDYRRFWQAEIQVPSMSYEEIWEWENPGRTLEGLSAEEKRQELTPIYTSLSRERSKKRKR